MTKLPPISGKELVSFLKKIGYKIIRIKGSHVRLKSEDGKYTTVPIHADKELPKGLLRKIIREDLEIELEEFIELYNSKK
jgi:predicted RNA binding protein YcfA (HicA-like mRNA interferase family)